MAAPMRPLVVTGASGFVGRALIEQLRADDAHAVGAPRDVTLLVRHPTSLADAAPLPPSWRIVACDLALEALPAGSIAPGSVIVHLAAATGKLAPAVMRAVNVDGTRRVVQGAIAAGAAHVILVSSIAASFSDRRWYHYAEAKREAEALVAASGIGHTIVRPTMVFGTGSPVQEGLQRLALGGAPIVLGSGEVQLQPIAVEDLAAFLVALADDAQTIDASSSPVTMEVGGGERLTLRALLARMRLAHTRTPREPWGIPIGLLRLALGTAEPLLGTRLPVTAGQLASFVNDSAATPSALVSRLLPSPRPLSRMLLPADPQAVIVHPGRRGATGATATPTVQAPATRDTIVCEFELWARYLGTERPSEREVDAYLRSYPSAVAIASDDFDRTLVSLARRSTAWCALADSYARLARPYGTLRRTLVLALAVLESSPRVHADYDTAHPSGPMTAWLSLAASGAAWGVRTVLAALVFVPLHVLARRRPPHGAHG